MLHAGHAFETHCSTAAGAACCYCPAQYSLPWHSLQPAAHLVLASGRGQAPST